MAEVANNVDKGKVLRKRQLISKASKSMFIWVAVTSAIVGASLVVSIMLVGKLIFNEKILAEKSRTSSTLTKDLKSVDELKNQIRVLNTNESLKSAMIPGEKEPVQVVLDALPSTANSSAFGASLQKKFLSVDGVGIESLTVEPVAGIEAQASSSAKKSTTTVKPGTSKINFSFTVSVNIGAADGLKKVLQNLEHSIRPIDISNLDIEVQSKKILLRANGFTYYEPAQTVDLKDKTVKP